MLDFVSLGILNNWLIERIGVGKTVDEITINKPASRGNMERNDSIGEFRNRPIFILKSKK